MLAALTIGIYKEQSSAQLFLDAKHVKPSITPIQKCFKSNEEQKIGFWDFILKLGTCVN